MALKNITSSEFFKKKVFTGINLNKKNKVVLKFSQDHENTHDNPNEYSIDCLRKLSNRICKPCWELRYCPYGPLVEDFPLPPITKDQAETHRRYLQNCLETNQFGTGETLDDQTRKIFEEEVENYNPEIYQDEIPELAYMKCTTFGHICPVYFVADKNSTETIDPRRSSRYIPQSSLIKIVRRDNSICQLCAKIVLDNEIEIDHIIPISKGGPTHESNLRVLCRKCNRNKSNKLENFLK